MLQVIAVVYLKFCTHIHIHCTAHICRVTCLKLSMKEILAMPSTMKNSLLSLATVLMMLSVSTSALSFKPYAQTIIIDAKNGSDSSACLTSGSSLTACQSLDWALDIGHRMNSTQYILSAGTHYINQAVGTFKDLSNIAFSGRGNSSNETVIHCTNSTAALAYENVTNISITNITFFNCSAIRNSTSKNFHLKEYKAYQFYVALYFYSCKNVMLSHVSVENSPGATGVVMYDTDGDITVTNCTFSNNSVDPNSLDYPGGGGFYVEFTYCIPGDVHCQDSQRTIVSHTSRNADAKYVFDNCTFVLNNASNPQLGQSAKNSTSFIVPFRADHMAFGRGGGLSIFVKGNATRNSFVVNNCHFINNSALWGGGLFVEFHDNTSSNAVIVTGSSMKQNECFFTADFGTAGGGMRLGHYVFGNSANNESIGNHITISGCRFTKNSALNGGGLSISPTMQNVPTNLVASVKLSGNWFIENYARLGAALHIDRFTMITEGHMLTVSIEDNTFFSNSVDFARYLFDRYGKTVDIYQMGVGAMYVSQVNVAFVNTVFFAFNNGSAIAAIGTELDFTNCVATFYTNLGYNGGAIALLGLAYLRIDNNTQMYFTFNLATVNGGAIYNRNIERENLISYDSCFIRHTDFLLSPDKWGAKFEFSSNNDQAGSSLNSIHTTSLLPCTWGGENLIGGTSAFCWPNWEYHESDCTDQVKTDVGSITLNTESNLVEAIPGQQFQLPITILDDLKHNMTYQTLFSISENSYQNQSGNDSVRYIWQDRATLNGRVNSSVKLLLDGLSDMSWHVNIQVSFKDCPPGFKIDDNGTTCDCAGDYNGYLIRCDRSTSEAFLKDSIWMGTIPGQDGYFASLCPSQFCFSDPTTPLPKDADELDRMICGHYDRTGVICGKCRNDFGVAVNSPFYKCINCTDKDIVPNIFKYVAAVYIPLISFFTLIILLDIRLTSGSANAFILYSQLVTTTFNLNADGQIRTSSMFPTLFSIPYGVFNLQFFEGFLPNLCFGSLNTLSVIALDYIVAVFPLLIILIVVCLVKLKDLLSSICGANRFQFLNHPILKAVRQRLKVSGAILPAFSSFLLLSYHKFNITSAYLLGSQGLISDTGQSSNVPRVYYYGNYSIVSTYYTRLYLPLASIVIATFVAIPPLLLLDFPIRAFEWCISKVDCLWRIYPVGKVQIFLDTFQGCYKNKMRCFSGLYFIFRLVINTAYLTTATWLGQYYIQQMACLFMIGLLLVCQPYNKEYKVFNIVDILIFLNLSALNTISFYQYSLSLTNPNTEHPRSLPSIVQQCLVYLPILFMFGYIVWYFIKPYQTQIKFCLLRWMNLCYRKEQTHLPNTSSDGNEEERIRQGISSLSKIVEKSGEEYSEEEALFHRAESVNRYRTYTSTLIGIENQTEGVATIQTDSTNDSGLRSSILSAMHNYGSNGSTQQSNSSQSNSESRTTHTK